ncbi:MAG: lysylphosphatidylglycerol synthase domain-containing protein [Actinomycetes bacterium]
MERAIGRTRGVWVRRAGGAVVLCLLVWQYGTEPFVRGLSSIHAAALVTALAVGALTTVCCAWRWRLVAGALGLDVPLGGAVAAYYRSQMLNVMLPGGVLGDLHRAVDRGRRTGHLGVALRSVAWERGLGQLVQMALTAVVLVAVPSAIRPSLPVVAVSVLAAAVILGLAGLAASVRVAAPVRHDLRAILRARRTAVGVVVASVVAVIGHATVFLVASRTAGAHVPAAGVLPLALVVLLVAAVPVNLAGWGPREGAAAWVFGVAGLGASHGVTASVVYGVMVLAAALPGALVLVVLAGRRASQESTTARPVADVNHG